jgi:putative hydrolase of HD superfamily
MRPDDIENVLTFLRAAERLKVTHRSGYTSAGNPESVAEHTWRLCLMAMLIQPSVPGVDFARLIRICIVHDLGEAIGGDIPAPEQARRMAAGQGNKSGDERRDLVTLVAPLPSTLQHDMLALWDEYEAAATPEARLAKALDKLETILQHTQGKNPPDFDHAFNLGYGRQHTERPQLIADIRAILDRETARLAEESRGAPATPEAG